MRLNLSDRITRWKSSSIIIKSNAGGESSKAVLLRRTFITSLLGGKVPHPNSSNRHKEKRRKIVQYPADTVFDVVADVGNYQNFLPYILKSKVLAPKKELRAGVMGFDAQVEVGCSILSDRFRSKVELHHKQQHFNSQIIARCTESSVVDEMLTVWSFIPKGKNLTEVIFEVEIDIYDPIKYSTLSSVFSYMAQTYC